MPVERQQERPRFTSVSAYSHPSGLLSFWYPPEWQLRANSGPLPSCLLLPDPKDAATHVAIAVQDVGQPVTALERPAILEGVREGLAQLESCTVERLVELDQSDRWGVEWICTFAVAGQSYRRRARLFYSDRYQYSVVLQGATEERYTYWQGMFEFVLLTVGSAPLYLSQWTDVFVNRKGDHLMVEKGTTLGVGPRL